MRKPCSPAAYHFKVYLKGGYMKVERVCRQCGKTFLIHNCYLKRGQGKFCSISCGVTFRNLHDNPSSRVEVREKISKNHADVSGENNPMYGKSGELAPCYIDGRSKFKGETYRKILLAAGIKPICEICGSVEWLHVHHKDGNHKNNNINNLAWLCVNCHNTVAHKYERDEKGRFISATLNIKEEL